MKINIHFSLPQLSVTDYFNQKKQEKINKGHFFINFINPINIIDFIKEIKNKKLFYLKTQSTSNLCNVTYSTQQFISTKKHKHQSVSTEVFNLEMDKKTENMKPLLDSKKSETAQLNTISSSSLKTTAISAKTTLDSAKSTLKLARKSKNIRSGFGVIKSEKINEDEYEKIENHYSVIHGGEESTSHTEPFSAPSSR
jgi:hypothetical protein